MENITRTAGKYTFELKLTEVLMADSRNSPSWFSQSSVIGVLDVLESMDVLDGTGQKVNDLYNRIIMEYNARARQTGDSGVKFIRGSSNAQILKVRYQNVDEKAPVGPLEFNFRDYVGMERPRFLEGERTVVDTFRGVKTLDSR